jgi:hypothetical protein
VKESKTVLLYFIAVVYYLIFTGEKQDTSLCAVCKVYISHNTPARGGKDR